MPIGDKPDSTQRELGATEQMFIAQRDWNKRIEGRVDVLAEAVAKIKNQMWFFVGLCAACSGVGGFLGSLLK